MASRMHCWAGSRVGRCFVAAVRAVIFAFFGGLIFVILAAALAGLKLTGIVSWSWWWVMLPLWAAIDGAVVKMRIAARDPRF
jgi:hypothetical protein